MATSLSRLNFLYDRNYRVFRLEDSSGIFFIALQKEEIWTVVQLCSTDVSVHEVSGEKGYFFMDMDGCSLKKDSLVELADWFSEEFGCNVRVYSRKLRGTGLLSVHLYTDLEMSTKSMKSFFISISHLMSPYTSFVDLNVWGKNKSLRLPFSKKLHGSNTRFMYSYHTGPKTLTATCPWQRWEVVDKNTDKTLFPLPDCVQFPGKYHCKTTGGITTYIIHGPWYCPEHKRVHDSENFWVDCSGNFHCYRDF